MRWLARPPTTLGGQDGGVWMKHRWLVMRQDGCWAGLSGGGGGGVEDGG